MSKLKESILSNISEDEILNDLIHILIGEKYDELRGGYWAERFKSAGRGLNVKHNVNIIGAENICVGDNVVIEDNVSIYSDACSIEIGSNTLIRKGSVLIAMNRPRRNLKIGENCQIGFNSVVNTGFGLTLGDCVIVGPNVNINNFNHSYNKRDVPIRYQGGYGKETVIGDDCWICTGAIILGSKIAKGCVIAAGALVNNDFHEYQVIGGIPAEILKER